MHTLRAIRRLEKLPAWLLVMMVRLYQVTLSPWIGQSCRFQPTCSNYMIQAVGKYGFWRGLWRGIRRIARCHPLHAGGYDPP
jgi:putative membrane protein insertion efficiency factor